MQVLVGYLHSVSSRLMTVAVA